MDLKNKLAIICVCRNPNTMLAKLVQTIHDTEKVIPMSDMWLIVTFTVDVSAEDRVKFEKHCEKLGLGITILQEKYHFATTNNKMVDVAFHYGAKELLFTNDDIELTDENTLSTMLDTLRNAKNAGTVGLYLRYPNNTVQHIGIKLVQQLDKKHMFDIGVTHNYLGFPCEQIVPASGTTYIPVLGNTFAFLMMRTETFKILGGLNANYKKCFEDVEINLKAKVAQYNNYCVVSKSAIHLESKTRGPNDFDFLDICRLYVFTRDNLEHFGKL